MFLYLGPGRLAGLELAMYSATNAMHLNSMK